MSSSTPKARRIFELDLIRGFFIMVIILDHMQRWPSPFTYVTGEGRLWVTAAEGFFIISGLLIGYLRAYKQASVPLLDVAKKLWRRAGMLWLWSIIITFAATVLLVLLPNTLNPHVGLPQLPSADTIASLPAFIWAVVSQQYVNDWIYFLRMYAIVLALTPVFLWLLRRGQWAIAFAISFIGFVAADHFNIPDPTLQWQFLFFSAALLGWKFEAILAWFAARPKMRYSFLVLLMSTTLATMTLSFFFTHGWKVVEAPQGFMSREEFMAYRDILNPLFTLGPFTLWRVLLAFLWFGGLLALFHIVKRPLQAAFGWLLMEFGQYSLTAYCLQAIFVPITIAFIGISKTSLLENFIVSCLILVGFWAIMKIPLVKRILPQ